MSDLKLEPQSPENKESFWKSIPVIIKENEELSEAEKIKLRKILQIFEDYNNPELSKYQFQRIRNLLNNPDAAVSISNSNSMKNFISLGSKHSLKDVIGLIKNFVRNRYDEYNPNTRLPRFRTKYKNKEKNSENKFNIEEKEMDFSRIKLSKREKTSHSSTWEKNSVNKGKIVTYTNIPSSKVAVFKTILNSISNNKYDLQTKTFHINESDWMYPKYEANVKYNIILVLDISSSISWVRSHIENLVSYITSNVSKGYDKLGLITFSNDQAKIFHYPTRNIKQVIGTVNTLSAKGGSPLGKGLKLAIQVFSKNQYKQIGYKNIVVLISDCYPEPLEGNYKNLLDEPSYKLVISTAKKMDEQGIGFIIINPAEEKERESWNTKLIQKILANTKARYVKLNPKFKGVLFQSEEAKMNSSDLVELFNEFNDLKYDL